MSDKEVPQVKSETEKTESKKKPRWRRWLFRSVMTFLGLIALYSTIVLIGLLPANADFVPTEEGVQIFVTSNAVHADIVMPIDHQVFNWREKFPGDHFPGDISGATHVAIGWGDTGFYVHTPQWSDLKLSTALNALLLPSPCCLHVILQGKPRVGENVRSVRISPAQYEQMAQQIAACFKQTEAEKYALISDASYGKYDTFYEAHGNYHALNTCNSWVGWILRSSGVKAPLLSPMPKSVFLYLPEPPVEDQ